MQFLKLFVAGCLLIGFSGTAVAQSTAEAGITQAIRGQVLDLDTQAPLIGVNVIVLDSQPLLGASTNEDGRFVIQNVPVGRVSIQITYIGYEPLLLSDVLVTSGKELVLDLELQESVIETEGVVVVAEELEGLAVNEMAAVSARSFSVEQTQRYAASISDPARMAQTFAGVSGGGDDLLNEIVVRGNSPRGLLWRLEGIEIPNPNHFGDEGASGGGVSMLSASTLTRSDFFTGAFPAEYGNASSGVFDLFLRNGNTARTEYALQVGVLGVDASLEGPFAPGYSGSYLINYRYSTLGILNNFGVLPEESIQYQDLSFKFNFPTKSGRLTLFGLAGDAQDIYGTATPDSTLWESTDDAIDGKYSPQMGVVGASHVWLISSNTYVRTIAALAGERRRDNELLLVPSDNYRAQPLFEQDTRNWALRGSIQLNHKFSAKQTLQVGLIGSQIGYNLASRSRDGLQAPWFTFFDQKGNTQMLESYSQLKLRPTAALTLTPGLHYTYFALNNTHQLEPRAGVTWQVSPTQTLSAGVGLHSRTESVATYLMDRTDVNGISTQPHKNLGLMKAWHYVVGYDHYFSEQLRFKLEAYYQHLYDIPVSSFADRPFFATINTEDIWDLVSSDDVLINEGTGQNYGLELTVEKFLSNGYYYLFTGSLYDAKYTPLDGNTYNSRYAGNYVANLVGGKEFRLKKGNLLGFNARFILAGGNRYIPLNVEASRAQDRFIFDLSRTYEERVSAYYRLDFGVSYTINRASLTHAIRFDLQNVTGRENIQGFDYNRNFEQQPFFHAGLIPILSYRVTF